MTLLAEVIDGASGDAPVATLLRKLKIVAPRSGSDRLADWVERELNGYPDATDLPEYRGSFAVVALGHFVGPFGSELQNIKIPVLTFPEEMRPVPYSGTTSSVRSPRSRCSPREI